MFASQLGPGPRPGPVAERNHCSHANPNLTCLHRPQAVCSWITCDTIERCRLSCGGHGYSLLSGLPSIYASYVQNATWEGDNNVLCLQARVVGQGFQTCRVFQVC